MKPQFKGKNAASAIPKAKSPGYENDLKRIQEEIDNFIKKERDIRIQDMLEKYGVNFDYSDQFSDFVEAPARFAAAQFADTGLADM